MMELFRSQMVTELGKIGINLTDRQMNQFYDYYEILIQWNQVMNLTTITEMNEVVTKHFVDSLSIVKADCFVQKMKQPFSIIDVGTGAGFPGIPLKIAFPEIKVALLDSLNKRVNFLMEVIHKLELTGISAIHGRAEDLGRDINHREKYDFCLSRAVANLSTLSEYCMPFVKIGGYFIPYKSGKLEEELQQGKNAVKKLGGRVEGVEKFILPDTDSERSLVLVKKTVGISKVYPRKAGLPSKEPLY